MARAMTAEPVPTVLLPQIERRALDVLPAEAFARRPRGSPGRRSRPASVRPVAGASPARRRCAPQSGDRAAAPRKPDARSARRRSRSCSSAIHAGAPSHASSSRDGRYGRILGARPDVGRPLCPAATRRRVIDRGWDAGMQKHAPGRGLRRALGRGDRRPQYLTVGLVAQIEPVGAVASAIREREGADGDGQRLQCRRLTVTHRLSRQDACDVGSHRQRRDGVSPARLQDADSNRARQVDSRRSRRGRSRQRRRRVLAGNAGQRQREHEPPHWSSSRKARTSFHTRGKLAINWWSSSSSESVT